MLTYSFENIGSDCLYEHLYKCIRQDILAGRIPAGNKLPSKRSLAKNLDVSIITVENAYGQLVSEGYLHALPKKGFFAADLSVAGIRKTGGTPVVEENKAEKERAEKENAEREEKWLADLTSNLAEPETFPFAAWSRLSREVLSQRERELLQPSPGEGIPELRRAIAAHLREFRGIDVTADQIVVGAGNEYLYSLLLQLLGQDKTYGVENPGYQKIPKIYRSHQVACVRLPLDAEGVSMEALAQSGADVLHISPSHHFPTGRVTPISRRYELLDWASRGEERYIIEDDYDSEFRLLGRPIPAMASIDVLGKIIYMNTFSKSLTPTIRISYLVLPRGLAWRFREKLSFYSCTVSNFEQYTLAAFLEQGLFEKHINRMRVFYKKRRDRLLEVFDASPMKARAEILEENAGLHFLMRIKTQYTDEVLTQRARERGLRIQCLSQYYYGGIGKDGHVLVVNYSGVDPEAFEKALNLLSLCLEEEKK